MTSHVMNNGGRVNSEESRVRSYISTLEGVLMKVQLTMIPGLMIAATHCCVFRRSA